jgi:hypothetical protein
MTIAEEIKGPPSFPELRRQILAADPKLDWPEWAMPDARIWLIVRRGEFVSCVDCGGLGEYRLPSGKFAPCACAHAGSRGRIWTPKWTAQQAILHVQVNTIAGPRYNYSTVHFLLDETIDNNSLRLEDMFLDEVSANAVCAIRNRVSQ